MKIKEFEVIIEKDFEESVNTRIDARITHDLENTFWNTLIKNNYAFLSAAICKKNIQRMYYAAAKLNKKENIVNILISKDKEVHNKIFNI